MKVQQVLENTIVELDREKKSRTSGHIYMRFGLKKPVAAVAGDDAKSYIVGYAGFANTPADLKHGEAQWKFYNLNKKEDFVKAVKKIMADETFTRASGIIFYVDAKSLLKKYPGYGEFISMIEKTGGDKFSVEYKPDSDKEKSEKGAGKKRVKGQWADPDARVEPAEKQTTRYFTVTNPRLMNQLRRNDRVMQYYRPNKNAFVMGPKEFDAFVKTFGRDDIKIVDKFREELELDEAFPAIPLIIAGAKLAGPVLIRQGARILAGSGRAVAATPGAVAQVGTGIGRAGVGIGVGSIGLGVADSIKKFSSMIENAFGSEVLRNLVNFTIKYHLHILATVAIFYGGKKVLNYLRKKGEETKEVSEGDVVDFSAFAGMYSDGAHATFQGQDGKTHLLTATGDRPRKFFIDGKEVSWDEVKQTVGNQQLQPYQGMNETATAGGTSAGGIAGFAVGIGSPDPKKKKKSKLIKR